MPDTLKLADVDRERSKRLAQRMHVKQDDITIVRKGYEVKAEEANDAERTIVARVSTADRDRDGEIVEPKGIELKDYSANPVLMWAHNYGQPAIGKALWSKTDEKGLICKFQFAPTQFADEIYQLYKGGYQRAFSIGFIPVEFDQQTKTHKKISLLEVSAVPVPANQSALVMEAYAKGIVKSAGLIKDLEIDIASEAKAEHVVPVNPPTDAAEFVQVGDVKIGPPGVTTTNVPDDAPVAVVDLAPAADPEPVAKMFDTEQNPSVADIWAALDTALNPPAMMEKPGAVNVWKCLWDIYPVAYPNGHAVYGQRNADDTANEGFMVDYSFEKGGATIGEKATPVAPAYVRRRGGKVFDASRLMVVIQPSPEVKAMLDELSAKLDKLMAPIPREPEPPALDIEPSPEIEIEEPAKPAEVIELSEVKSTVPGSASEVKSTIPGPAPDPQSDLLALFKSIDWKATIHDVVKLEIDKARGIVR